jgi:superfamily II DNA or RNA helicase
MNNNWFESRNLKVLAYQTDTINKVKDSLSSQEITVLAACPSAGKTIMAIHCIEDFLRKNPNSKVIVLAHGTTILRTQFHDVLEEIKPNFTYKLADNFSKYDESKAVNVCLPQTLNKKSLIKIDLLVVDEAHQFYFGEKMVKDIIKKTKPRRQLLLTGTPSIFIREKHPIIPVTLNTIFDEGMVSDVYVEIATSSYNFDIYDYNTNDELKSEVHFKDSETKKTLDDLIAKIVERLKSIRGNEYVNLLPEWLPTLKRLQKTMIACKSQRQAIQVKNYFDKIGVKSALSISDIDYDSVEIENFKADPDCLILIVVGRGILGFNYPELVNVVDMTTSMNVDRVYQLFCRVVRKHPNGLQKLFFKVAPNTLSDYYKYVMTGVLALSDEYYFTHFNGKNFNDMQIPVRPHINGNNGGGNNTNDTTTIVPNRKIPVKRLSPIDFSALPVFELFKDIYHKKDSLLHTYAFTTIREVRVEFLKSNYGYWTFEKCIESALKYNTIKDWDNNDRNAYYTAMRNKWLAECTKHMVKLTGFWTKEKCIESASKCQNSGEWAKIEGGAYDAAIKHNWFNEITKLLGWKIRKSHGYWTKEKVLKSALPYNTIDDWSKAEEYAYKFAGENGFLDECTKHMTKLHDSWTKEKCMESASKYNTINDWNTNEPNAVSASRRNGWQNECITHMQELKKTPNYWTKELCTKSANNYSTMRDWMNNEGGAYRAAKRNGWYNELTSHFKKRVSPQKPAGYWTKEKCIESAKSFQTFSEWRKKYAGAYDKAFDNDWLFECTIHMKK